MGAQYTDGHEIGYDTGMARPLTLDALRLDTTAWTVLRDSPSLRAWRLPSGDGVAAEIFDRPPDLRAQSITTLRDQFRERALSSGGALISAGVARAAGHACVLAVLKFPQPTGMAYLASVTWPFRSASLVVKVQAAESGPTGVREAALLPSFLDAHPGLNPKDRPNAWMHDAYQPERADPLMRTVADDGKYDAVFPDHPLSRARRTLHDLVTSAELDAEVVGGLKEFPLPEPA
jgi:hypothetical protein